MTYNTPVLLNVDTAFNVVLGSTIEDANDHVTEGGPCRETESSRTSGVAGCPL
jgi:hypothetical protein